MNIVYDVSVLGSALYSKRARTGVARVIDNLGLALKGEKDIELSCCAFHSLQQYLQLRVNSNKSVFLNSVSLRHPENRFSKLISEIVRKTYPKANSTQHRLLERHALTATLKISDYLSGGCDCGNMEGVDIFHSTFYPFPEWSKKFPSLRRFITVYDLIPILYPQYFSNTKRHLVHKIVECIGPDDWVIAISEATKNDLCSYTNIQASRVFVTPLAASKMFYQCIDLEKISTTKIRYGITEGPYVLSLCTLEPRKNIDQVIRSFIALAHERGINELSLVLIGTKGWDFEHIFSEISVAQAQPFKNRIVITGYVPDEDLAALYSGAMMFVYPSYYEGFGLPPLEAMQCGVPVITSNSSSLPEVVGKAGIMVEPKDGDAMCQAMLTIYNSTEIRQKMAADSLLQASKFSWKKCAVRTIAAYKSTVAE